MSKELFTPYIPGAYELDKSEVDAHIDLHDSAYWGLLPPDAYPVARSNHVPIWIEDDSGVTPYSVSISGDLQAARKILIKTMQWSDHPGRGFEALRQLLIADDEQELAVVGVSFPGMGLNSPHMTPKQAESIGGQRPDLGFIAAQQWEVVSTALARSLEGNLTRQELEKRLQEYEIWVGGYSQGATNAVSLLKSAPEGVRINGLIAIENPSWAARSLARFIRDYIPSANKHFGEYVGRNAYNDMDKLGPAHNTFKNVVTRPEAHVKTVSVMRRGGDVERIIDTVRQTDNHDLVVAIAGASEDEIDPPESNEHAKQQLVRHLGMGHIALTNWQGHYHPVMENLANAQHAFRSFIELS